MNEELKKELREILNKKRTSHPLFFGVAQIDELEFVCEKSKKILKRIDEGIPPLGDAQVIDNEWWEFQDESFRNEYPEICGESPIADTVVEIVRQVSLAPIKEGQVPFIELMIKKIFLRQKTK